MSRWRRFWFWFWFWDYGSIPATLGLILVVGLVVLEAAGIVLLVAGRLS